MAEPARRRKRITVDEIVALYEDAQRCAAAAGLRYSSPDEPGIRRVKRGKGFSYIDADGKCIDLRHQGRGRELRQTP